MSLVFETAVFFMTFAAVGSLLKHWIVSTGSTWRHTPGTTVNDGAISVSATSPKKHAIEQISGALLKKITRCPFLIEGSRSIHRVRPFACTARVSTTPRDWCGPESPFQRDIKLVRMEIIADNDIPYFAECTNPVNLTNMRALVN